MQVQVQQVTVNILHTVTTLSFVLERALNNTSYFKPSFQGTLHVTS